ncbi:MAG TPA: NAD(P)H-hydrate epimerase, partial [Nitrososphaeria archaeon]|nr:NAD(P)H-hydrate epimerase [Nitrososphaeria archaeon]
MTASEMAAIDENSEWLGVPRALLMENAGAWVARIAYQWLGGAAGKKIVIFCGTGNNGGDGFAAARHLAGLGAEVHVVLIGDPRKIRTPEAKANYDVLCSMRESVKLSTVRTVEELEEVRGELEDAEAVIDGIFGTGIRGEIREPWRSAIRLINSAKGLRIAVDIPSGMDPDTGEVRDLCVNANVTVTFHRPKAGMPAAADYCGELVIAPIGIPPEAEIVMGLGDARQALSSMSCEASEIALLGDLPDEARKLIDLLGSRIGRSSGEIAYVGERLDLLDRCEKASIILGVGGAVDDPRFISIMRWDDAWRTLGIRLE